MTFWETVKGNYLADAVTAYFDKKNNEPECRQHTVRVSIPDYTVTGTFLDEYFDDEDVPMLISVSLPSALSFIQQKGGKVTLIQKISQAYYAVLYEAEADLFTD